MRGMGKPFQCPLYEVYAANDPEPVSTHDQTHALRFLEIALRHEAWIASLSHQRGIRPILFGRYLAAKSTGSRAGQAERPAHQNGGCEPIPRRPLDES